MDVMDGLGEPAVLNDRVALRAGDFVRYCHR
jgi:hypothetical protein